MGYLSVQHIEQLGALVFFVPLAKIVAHRKYPLLGPCLFLIATGAPDTSIEFELLDGIQQGRGLEAVPTGIPARFLLHLSLIYGILHLSHNELQAKFGHQLVPERYRLWKIMPRIYVH